jgi:hypothetical protein
MPNPMTRRRALPWLFAAATAPIVATTSLQVAAAPLVEGETLPQGYGRCSACACAGYTGSGDICQNCGHNYRTHW